MAFIIPLWYDKSVIMVRLSKIKPQSQILYAVSQHGPIGIAQISSKMGGDIPHTTLSRYLKELKDYGLITPDGLGRAVKYSVTQGPIRAYDFDLSVYDTSDTATSKTLFNHNLFDSCEAIFSDDEIKK